MLFKILFVDFKKTEKKIWQ